MENMNTEKKALLMLSGGRDSFLSACRLIEDGYQVLLVTYDNGHMSKTDNVRLLSDRLGQIFGTERVKHVGIHFIAQNIRPLLNKALYQEPAELCKEYPHLLLSQVNCLACHTAMYFHSIAYCKAHGIKVLAEGAREKQKFFVELPEMKNRYEDLCQKYDILLQLPVYDLKSDIERKDELGEWGFLPKSFEPQCWLGCAMLQELTDDQRKSLTDYYDKEIVPQADVMIRRLTSQKKVLADCPVKGSYV